MPLTVAPSVRLGSTAHRAKGKVYLKPPHYTTYLVADREAKRFLEYDLKTGELLGPFGTAEMYSTQYCFGIKPDGRNVREVNDHSNHLQVWDFPQQRLVFDLKTANAQTEEFACALSGDGRRLVTVVHDLSMEQTEADRDAEGHFINAVRVYDVDSQRQISEIPTIHNFNVDAAISPDGNYLAIGGEWEFRLAPKERPPAKNLHGMVQMWDLVKRTELKCIQYDDRVSFQFISKPSRLAVRGWNRNSVEIYAVPSGKKLCVLQTSACTIRKFLASADGEHMAAVVGGWSNDPQPVLRWKLSESLNPTVTIPPIDFSACSYIEPPADLAFHPDGTLTAINNVDGQLIAWSVPSGEKLTATANEIHNTPPEDIVFSQNGKKLFTTARSFGACEWTRDGQLVAKRVFSSQLKNEMDSGLRFSETGEIWAVCHSKLHLVNPTDMKAREILSHPDSKALSCRPQIRSDGRYLLYGLQDRMDRQPEHSVYLADLRKATCRCLTTLEHGSLALAFCGKHIVVLHEAESRIAQAWCFVSDSKSEDPIWTKSWEKPEKSEACYNVDLIASRNGSTVLLWPCQDYRKPTVLDAASGKQLGEWTTQFKQGATSGIRGTPAFAVRPDGSAIAGIVEPDGIHLLDWLTGETIAVIAERGTATAMAWSPDGSCLAVANPDTTVQLYDVRS